jgi:hypothetical protein
MELRVQRWCSGQHGLKKFSTGQQLRI